VLLALVAPLAALACIEYLRSVWWTFAVYHAGVCLVVPFVESKLAGRSWRGHMVMLGLIDPKAADGPDSHDGSWQWLRQAVGLGLVTALVTGGFLVLTRNHFLEGERLQATVAGWGVSPGQVIPMLAVMAFLNAPAEELFWRGYFPGRVAAARPSRRPAPALTIVLPAFLYASYHAVTIGRLVGEPGGVVAMVSGVVAAGLLWGWLRQRTGSVWMPMLSHTGAVLAYLAVHFWLTGGSR
jgi:membrane protease YdiL (CAAX protease family)